MKCKNLYDKIMSPLEKMGLAEARAQTGALVHGDVLEVGVGTGAMLSYYNYDNINSIALVDKFKSKKVAEYEFDEVPVTYLQTGVSKLPFNDRTFDCAVSTLCICSLKEPYRALSEIKRTLRPRGKLYFIEHIRPRGAMGAVFDLLNVVWKVFTRGCNINRNTVKMLEVSGFKVISIKRVMFVFVVGVAEKI